MTCPHQHYPSADPQVAALGAFGAAALRYAAAGLAVVPLERGGKRPHHMLPARGGLHHGTIDPHQIADWWMTDPAANIGVLTGRVNALIVVDLDVKGAANGIGEWARAMPSYRWDQRMPGAVETPSGGRHIWLRTPEYGMAVPERPAILPGVDIKGDGGLVVAPPSMKLVEGSGREVRGGGGQVPVPYVWTGECALCWCLTASEPLMEWIATAPQLGTPGSLPDADLPEIEEAERTGFREGSRNAGLYRMACSMYRRFGLHAAGLEEVWRRLHAMYLASDQGKMSERELRVIAESARRFIESAVEQDQKGMERSAEWLRQFS
jgi:hypothetical protein